jgi:hypothetical protein
MNQLSKHVAASLKTFLVGLSLASMIACTANDFAGQSKARKSEDATSREPGTDNPGEGGTDNTGTGGTDNTGTGGTGTGDNTGTGSTGTGDNTDNTGPGGTGIGNEEESSTSGPGNIGDDEDLDNKIPAVDDDEVTASTRTSLKVRVVNFDSGGANLFRVQYVSSKGDGAWQEAPIPKSGGFEIAKICNKKGTTNLRVRAVGKSEYAPGDINVGLFSASGSSVKFTVDMDGCGIGTCVEADKDTTLELSCPKGDLTIEGFN